MDIKPVINVVSEILCASEKLETMAISKEDDRNLLENNRIANMTRIDWGRTMAVSNQYIHRNILRYMLSPFGYSVYSIDDSDMPEINIANNSPGFDLVVITPEKKIYESKVNLDKLKE